MVLISQDLELTDRVQINEDGNFIIEEVDWSDMGIYTCTVPGSPETKDTFLYPLSPKIVG